MPLILTPATEEHMIGYTETYIQAFEKHPMSLAIRPKGFTPRLYEHTKATILKSFRTTRNSYYFVVVDTDISPGPDHVVALAKWRLEDDGTYAELVDQLENPEKDQPPDVNLEARQEFFPRIGEARKATMGQKPYWHLMLLATRPKHERRGAAQLCINWGCQMADKDGLEVYLDSTIFARGFYEKSGFVIKKDDAIDLTRFGVDFTNHSYAMVRQPRSQELAN